MREEKRLKLLKELLKQELELDKPNLAYVEDLQLSIMHEECIITGDVPVYQMVENAK